MIAWDHRCNAFVFGFFGGLAINVMRWYLLAHNPTSEKIEFSSIYWGQFFGLAILGGVVALSQDLSKELSPFVAFEVGLSVPAIIKTGADVALAKRRRRTN